MFLMSWPTAKHCSPNTKSDAFPRTKKFSNSFAAERNEVVCALRCGRGPEASARLFAAVEPSR